RPGWNYSICFSFMAFIQSQRKFKVIRVEGDRDSEGRLDQRQIFSDDVRAWGNVNCLVQQVPAGRFAQRFAREAINASRARQAFNLLCQRKCETEILKFHPNTWIRRFAISATARSNTSWVVIAVMQRWSMGQSRNIQGAQSGGRRIMSAAGDIG